MKKIKKNHIPIIFILLVLGTTIIYAKNVTATTDPNNKIEGVEKRIEPLKTSEGENNNKNSRLSLPSQDNEQIIEEEISQESLGNKPVTIIPPHGKVMGITEYSGNEFISTWNAGASTQVTLPLESSGTYDFVVDWGDGSTNDTITIWNQSETTHTYAGAGPYSIIINGTLQGWQFNSNGDYLKIIEISQWGNISLGNSGSYFYGCQNLLLTATDAPDLTGTTTLYQAFRGCENLDSIGDMSNWNVTSVTNMSSMFYEASDFDQPLGSWNVSSVVDMSEMFYSATTFNQSINSWDVSSVTDMSYMFRFARVFNQNISSWDVSSVVTMDYMFVEALEFAGSLESWNVSSVTDMGGMFMNADAFNQNISAWDVSSVTDMSGMFANTAVFNQNISAWDVSSVTDIGSMFSGAVAFNQPLSNWNVSSVTDMRYVFTQASAFNQNISAWDVSSVTNMFAMFWYAAAFNQPLNSWNVSSATNMRRMFRLATIFNQPLGSWNVSSVVDMSEMFYRASDFNQPIGSWNVSSVTDMSTMFRQASDFNQDLSSWDISNVTDMDEMFMSITLSIDNYDQLLLGWSQLTLQNGVTLDAGNSRYSPASVGARQYINNTFGWTINDGGPDTVDTTVPDLDSPDNGTYDEGSTGNSIVWTADDTYPAVYNVTLDGSLFVITTAWTNGTITVDIDGLPVGVHNFTIVVYDTTGNNATDEVQVTVNALVDTTSPNLDSPSNVTYIEGSTGNEIVWTVSDTYPAVYNVTQDGSVYVSTTAWSNGIITVDIDVLPIGVHNFTIVVYDTSGNNATDEVQVTVNALVDTTSPNLDSPVNVTYIEGSIGNLIVWTAGDVNPAIYNVTLDGSLFVNTTSWTNGIITVDIDGLTSGTHTFTIVVYDAAGNSATDSVQVTIQIATTTTTTTSTISPGFEFLVIFGSLMILLIFSQNLKVKKKK